MSPTSYQAAPPRFITIADALCEVKLGARPRHNGIHSIHRTETAHAEGYEPYVQVMISCVAVCPPVPAVKPTSAVFPPTVAGILIPQAFVNVALVTVSVMVIVSVVPL